MHQFSLKCFGVGDGWPCPDRCHSAFLYRFGRVTLLVDCGEPISGSFKASGLGYDTIDRIFISHLHCDHIAGFFMLMQGFWLEQRQKDLEVHMPKDGLNPVRNMLDASCIFEELLSFRLNLHPLQAGTATVTQNVKVTPFHTTHLNSLRATYQKQYPQNFEAFSFLLESDRLRVAHSADIGAPEDLEPLLAKPVDLLVCEVAHFKPEDLFAYLNNKDIKRVIFMHLGRRYWERMEETRALASKMLPSIPFSFAHDQEEFVL